VATTRLSSSCECGNYEALEFLGGTEGYKRIWTDQQRHYCLIRVYPVLSSPLGSIALGHDLAAFAARQAGRVVRRVFPQGAGGGPAWQAVPESSWKAEGGAGFFSTIRGLRRRTRRETGSRLPLGKHG
jgi:hypothetical protein